jgi:hypothetical protein
MVFNAISSGGYGWDKLPRIIMPGQSKKNNLCRSKMIVEGQSWQIKLIKTNLNEQSPWQKNLYQRILSQDDLIYQANLALQF